MGKQPVVCVRLPDDLDAAVRQLSESQGLSVNEYMKALVQQAVYGTIASTDEGYAQARRYAAMIAHEAVRRALESIPKDTQEAFGLFGIVAPG